MPSRNTVISYLVAKQDLDRAQLRLEGITQRLLAEMEEEHAKTFQIEEGDKKHRFTYVRRENLVIDEPGLRRAMGARIYDKYTVKRLDRKRLEEAMDTGVVDSKLVGKFVTTKDGEPYIKYTASKEPE